MKKYLLALFLAAFLVVPALSYALVSDIDPNLPASECINIVNNLRYKDRDINKDGEVSTLQDFLQSQGYLNSEPTGYFGLLTVKAVKSFQKSNDISPSGYVGPATRAKIKSITCDTTIPEPTTQKFSGYLSPIGPNVRMWGTHNLMINESEVSCKEEVCAQSAMGRSYPVSGENSISADLKRYENSRVTIVGQLSWIDLEGGFWGIKAIRVIPTVETSTSPIISGVSGPKSLTVGETGTWTVKAYDKGTGVLSYSVNWGDRESVIDCSSSTTPCAMHQGVNEIAQQSATFTHSYSNAGTYSPIFIVTNTSGKSTKTSLSVKVGNVVVSPSIKVTSPNGGESLFKGQKKMIYWRDNQTEGTYACSSNTPCARPIEKSYEIRLVPYSAPCVDGYACPTMLIRAPYIVAKNVQSSSFGWTVGDVMNYNGSSDEIASDGSYLIQVCRTDSGVCDSSDGFFTINSPAVVSPVVTVTSPNGGDLLKGSTKEITWKDNITDNLVGQKFYDINLVSYSAPCSDGRCSMMPVHSPYIIAQKVAGYSYDWQVGNVISAGAADAIALDGSYQIQICRAGTEICDASDAFISLVSR